MSVTTIDPLGPEDRDGALWTGAALIVVAVHVALVVGYLLLRPEPAQQAEAPAVDVAFIPAADKPTQAAPEALPADPVPPVEQSNLAPPMQEPATPAAKAEPQPEPPPPPVALTTPEPPLPPVPDAPVVTAPPPEAIEPPPPPPKPVTAPERPAPKPAAEEDKAEKAKREKEKAKQEKAEQQKKEKEAKEKEARKLAQQRAASSASQAQRMAAAPNAGIESAGARAGQADWNRQVEAQLGRHAAYPADGGGASGTARVSVTIDRNGRLVSRRLAGSSGSPALDRAAMAIVERSQPFPRFLPGMTQAQIERTVPLHLAPR